MSDKLILPNENDKEKITVNVFDSLHEVIESGNKIVTTEGKEYYHLPYWFESVGGSWHMHHLNDLPDDLKDFIIKSRLGGDNPMPTNT